MPAQIERYRNFNAQLAENLEMDTNLQEADRNSFFAHLAKEKGNLEAKFINEFFYAEKNLRLGPDYRISKGKILGSTKVFARICQIFEGPDFLDLSPNDAEEFLRDLAAKGANEVTDFITSSFDPDQRLSPYQNWSFVFDGSSPDEYELLDHDQLPCALGLPSYGKGEHFSFGHYLSDDDIAKSPTAFDAGLMSEWRPGGRTKPHSDCMNEIPNGYEELIHTKVILHNIATQVYIT